MPIIERLGWMLFHSIWQILLIAGLYGIVLSAIRPRSANARYVAGCAALFLMALAPVATFLCLPAGGGDFRTVSPPVRPSPISERRISAAEPSELVEAAPLEAFHQPPAGLSHDEPRLAEAAEIAASSSIKTPRPFWMRAIRPALPIVVVFWSIGILILSLRPLVGLSQVRRFRRRGLRPVSAVLENTVQRISRRLGLGRRVDVALSPEIGVPIVLGIVRPLLILSPNALECLSPRQLEAVLAHELAHVRRHDFLVNLLQTLVETLLFYHPAIWWVSHRIREERENCCDDLAVAQVSDRVSYAEMLLLLEKSRPVPRLASAASGGSLLKRVRRIAVPNDPRSIGQGSAFLGGMVMVILSSLLAIWLAVLNGISLAADNADDPAAPVAASPEEPERNAQAEAGENDKNRDPKIQDKPEYDEEGFTKLHRASIGGRADEVSTLIDEGADVNVPQSTFQGTPLQYAAARGHKNVVELLLAAGAKVDAVDTAGRTPLMWAAQSGETEVVKVLLKNEADINAETHKGWTPFRYAARTGKKELVKLFHGKVQVDRLDKAGFSALHRAASSGDTTFAQTLIDAGADVNVCQKTYHGTPLQYAASEGHADVVKLLLKAKARIDAPDKFGRTPLMWAAMSGKKNVVEVLLAEGADVNASTDSDWTALRYAQNEGYDEIAKLLLKKFAGGAIDKEAEQPKDKADE